MTGLAHNCRFCINKSHGEGFIRSLKIKLLGYSEKLYFGNETLYAYCPDKVFLRGKWD